MFAGIVETTARVHARRPLQGAATSGERLEIEAAEWLTDSPLGASIAVNGVCLTLAERRERMAAFDVIPETLRLTNLGRLQPGERVNIERALRLCDRIDGHFVQGHVDGTGVVDQVDRDGGEWRVWVASPPALRPYLIRKGSVAIDGVSLTIAAVERERFCVALIPTTLERTNLAGRRPGDLLNLETDFVVRAVLTRLDALLAADAPPAAAAAALLESLRPADCAS